MLEVRLVRAGDAESAERAGARIPCRGAERRALCGEAGGRRSPVQRMRPEEEEVHELGAYPRAPRDLIPGANAPAEDGRAMPDLGDVVAMATLVLTHRLVLIFQARSARRRSARIRQQGCNLSRQGAELLRMRPDAVDVVVVLATAFPR